MPARLLFVVNDPNFFLSHRLPLAAAARQAGFEVHVATMPGEGAEQIRAAGFPHHVLPLSRSGKNPFVEFFSLLVLIRLFRQLKPGVVHLVTIKPVIYGGIAARIAGVSGVVAAISGLGFVFIQKGFKAKLMRWLVGRLYRIALGHANLRVVFQNPDDRQSVAWLAGLQEKQTVLIRGSGVDLDRYRPTSLPSGVPVVMLAARLLADKGVFEFVQAARLLKQRGCHARFALVGTVDPGNPASFTQAEVNTWLDEGVVECWGHRLDMPQVLAAAQVVVLPSYREGLPKVLLEAAACGRAVVTTDVPGCRDAIDPGVTGLLVPVRNAVALADALEGLINDPARCQTMGDAGRALAESAFDVRQVVAAHLRIYQELIDKS
jgi:glycosyltransferase involved in cell wall biosynthesis